MYSRISEWVYRDICQSCFPWNIRFAQKSKVPEFAARPALAEKDARTLARDLLAMTQEEFSTAFKGSPMKRAKLRGLKRNAAVVLGNVGDARDVNTLTHALDNEETLVRESAAWALDQVALADGCHPRRDVRACGVKVPRQHLQR